MRPSSRALRRVGLATAAALALVAAAAAAAMRVPGLLEVEMPGGDEVVGLGGFELLVRFDEEGRAEPSTFRALLNGADVTDQLETAPNGAHGRLPGLLEGPNRLRLEIFGRARWPWPIWVEESRELRVLYRPPPHLDRA